VESVTDPGWEKIQIQDEHSRSFFIISFWVMRIWIRDLVNPGSGIEKIESGIKIPDPQHFIQS
jgi:hypothetical protein